MRSLALWLGLCAAAPALAVVHSVTDFRADSSAAAGDQFRLDPGWGDSLLLQPQRYRYTTVRTVRLSDGHYNNGDVGSGPFVSATGQYKFKVMYMMWKGVTHDAGSAPNLPEKTPRANIVTRIIDLSPDTAAVSDSAKVLANQEVNTEVPPKFNYSVNNGNPPAPTYLNFAAEGNKYAGYWSSGVGFGPVRRITHLDISAATYVPPDTPAATGAFGKISSAMIPGSGGDKTVLAYETNFSPGRFQVRWEDIAAGTSVVSPQVLRTTLPEDFAVAADSAGNTVVIWRETTNLFYAAFDSTHAQILGPVLVRAGVAYNDSITHLFRPYAVASMTRGNFLIAYAAAAGGFSDIFTQTLALPAGTLGSAVTVTAGDKYCLFPDLAVSQNRVTVAWYSRSNTGGPRRMMGSIFAKSGNTFTVAGRTDIDLASENITFTGVAPGWTRMHWFKAANVAIDPAGNVVAAYDSGTHAKLALVRNTPIYYDSASFVSKILKVENPAVPAFVFNPASDSVVFLPFRPTVADTSKTHLKLALSATNAFSGPGAAFQSLPSPRKSAAGFYRYSVDMLSTLTGDTGTTNLTTPKLKSLDIEYNIKPGTPAVDSIKTGSLAWAAYDPSAQYQLLRRKDSLRIVCSGFDADDDGMEFRISLGNTVLKTATGTRTSPGHFSATLSLLPPDTLADPLILSLTTVDVQGWSSRALPLSFAFRNLPPSQTLIVYRNRGLDSANVYLPGGGGADTLVPVDGGMIAIQTGDSLTVEIRYADGNDADVSAAWLRNSTQLGTRVLPVGDSLSFRFSPDNLSPAIDTLVASAADEDTTVTFRILVRTNHSPQVDSLFHFSYLAKDGVLKVGPYDQVKDFGSDSGLVVPLALSSVIKGAFSDSDDAVGDSLSVSWSVWGKTPGCPEGMLSCYLKTDSSQASSLTHAFTLQDQYLTVRITDAFGAFLERKIRLEYPVLDTSGTGAAGFSQALNALQNGIDFIINADVHDTIVKAEILSQGTAPLLITSVATKNDDRKWLTVVLKWSGGSPPQAESLSFSGATNVNAIAPGQVISLLAASALEFDFHFFSDSLRGDSILTDTLLVGTNDFSSPVLKIPFRLQHHDLPVVRLEVPGAPGTGSGFNAAGLPALVPARSNIAMVFSETVRLTRPDRVFRVYSYLDSVKNPQGFSVIPGDYEYRRRASGLAKISAAGSDSLADTLIFTPRYAKASDSLKALPRPGYFIYRDILHIAVSNDIVDRAGNALDLRLNRKVLNPGSLDTVFQVRVDTSRFRVLASEPAPGATGWNPEGTIKVRFSRKLAKGPPQGADSLTLLSLNALKAADNRAIKVSSIFRSGKVYDFQFLSLADHDSSLLFRTRPFLPALDTVTISLSGGILDSSGLSLDGDGDDFPSWLYDQRDSVDAYRFTFVTADADFYVYPNPYRFADSRHREKGSITFKNLNTLSGYIAGNDITLRVHTMTGDLVYDSRKANAQAQARKKFDTSIDWDLMNSSGSLVGTGVYIYSIMREGTKLLRKGKVAVVR
ncbi:MAG: hypothetical protein ABI036_11585 [Fibrobacteria bacterium]